MTQTYFPFDSGAGASVTETQWSKMAQHFKDTEMLSGIMNELQVYADSTGMRVKVKSGAAFIKGHYFESDAEEILSIGSANATNPRIDLVIVRLDWTANTMQLAVLQGTPATTPAIPALTQNTSRWEIALAKVDVGANVSTIAAGNITDLSKLTKTGTLLWSGGSSMTGTVVITPDAPITSCKNGWVLRWEDNPGGGNTTYQHIHKDCAKGSDIMAIQPMGGGITPTFGVKRVKISNTTITGHDYNIQGNNTGRSLTEVRAW